MFRITAKKKKNMETNYFTANQIIKILFSYLKGQNVESYSEDR